MAESGMKRGAAATGRTCKEFRDQALGDYVLSDGGVCPCGTNFSARPLLHQRRPVGGGPSANIWPWWPLQRTQWYSVLGTISQ